MFFDRKSIIWIIHMFLGVFLISSCNHSTRFKVERIGPAQTRSNKVVLRFISPWAATSTKTGTLNQVLDSFMKNYPDIEIINESMDDDGFLNKLKTDFVSGNDPDVFALWPGINMKSFISANKIADLTTLLEKDPVWKSSFYKDALQFVMIENKIYGVPLEFLYSCLFVNKDIFEKYNVKIPGDFNELKKAAAELNQKGVVPIAYNGQAEGNLLYQGIIASLGGRTEVETSFVNDKINGCYLKATDYLKELYDIGAFPKNPFDLNNKERDDMFLQKRAAMIYQNSEFIGKVNAQLTTVDQMPQMLDRSENYRDQLTVDMINFPAIDTDKVDSTSLIYGLGSGTFFMSQATFNDDLKKEASIKLLKFLTSKQTAALFAEQAYMLVSIKIPPPNVYYGGLVRRGKELISDSKSLIRPPESFFDKIVWDDQIIKPLPNVLEGKMSSQSLWEKVKR